MNRILVHLLLGKLYFYNYFFKTCLLIIILIISYIFASSQGWIGWIGRYVQLNFWNKFFKSFKVQSFIASIAYNKMFWSTFKGQKRYLFLLWTRWMTSRLVKKVSALIRGHPALSKIKNKSPLFLFWGLFGHFWSQNWASGPLTAFVSCAGVVGALLWILLGMSVVSLLLLCALRPYRCVQVWWGPCCGSYWACQWLHHSSNVL